MTWFLLVVFVVLQGLDVYLTRMVLLKTIGVREGNPIVAWFMEEFGTTSGLVLPKIVLVSLSSFLTVAVGDILLWKVILACLVVVYVFVVRNNYRIARKRGIL
jgi:hypothetical protein